MTTTRDPLLTLRKLGLVFGAGLLLVAVAPSEIYLGEYTLWPWERFNEDWLAVVMHCYFIAGGLTAIAAARSRRSPSAIGLTLAILGLVHIVLALVAMTLANPDLAPTMVWRVIAPLQVGMLAIAVGGRILFVRPGQRGPRIMLGLGVLVVLAVYLLPVEGHVVLVLLLEGIAEASRLRPVLVVEALVPVLAALLALGATLVAEGRLRRGLAGGAALAAIAFMPSVAFLAFMDELLATSGVSLRLHYVCAAVVSGATSAWVAYGVAAAWPRSPARG